MVAGSFASGQFLDASPAGINLYGRQVEPPSGRRIGMDDAPRVGRGAQNRRTSRLPSREPFALWIPQRSAAEISIEPHKRRAKCVETAAACWLGETKGKRDDNEK